MTRSQKLELTWVGKDHRPRLEPRILVEDPALSYHAAARVTANDRFDNLLIQGDNLLALKALEQEYAGKVKCVYIDPPFNSQQAFEQYEDAMEHSEWLSMFRDRIAVLRSLLSEDGSIWVHLDDNEQHRGRCVMDEILGARNFIATAIWEKDQGRRNDAVISSAHEFIHAYAFDLNIWKQRRNLLPRTPEQNARYRNPDDDPRGPWLQGDNGTAKSGSEKNRFEVTLPSGRVVKPPKGNYWRFSPNSLAIARSEGRVHFGNDGDKMPVIKRYLTEVQQGVVPRTLWLANEVGSNQSAKRDHLRKLLPTIEPFATPKPEGLLERVFSIATNPGDLVLDSFLGSGTTAAVAHKMGRRWIGIELGDHAVTHCVPRLGKVIDGTDPGGVTAQTNWTGGGGFRFLRLAPSLLERDHWGNWVVSREYNAAMLAEAVCKLEGFRYKPNPQVFWQQGKSTEQDFLYVTTQTLDVRQLEWLSESVGPERSLLVLCRAHFGNAEAWPNLTLKKIPNAVLGRCEFGRDDYSLRIAALPDAPASVAADADSSAAPTVAGDSRRPAPAKRAKVARKNNAAQTDLLPGSDA